MSTLSTGAMSKRFDFEVKAVDDGSSFGSFEAVLSAPTVDRDNEVIESGAFEPLPAQIPVHADHDMMTRSLVGSAVPFYEKGVLKLRGTFASTPKAQEIRTLVKEGHLTVMSAGFMNPRIELKEGRRHIVKSELLEGSFVPVASCREAVVTGAKTPSPSTPPERKAVEGSYEQLREELRDAAAALTGGYAYLSASFDDRIVFESYDQVTGDWVMTEADWTRNTDGAIEITNQRPVQIVESIQPKSPSTAAASKDAAAVDAEAKATNDLAFAVAVASRHYADSV